MKLNRIRDLTVGAPFKVLMLYALPMFVSMFFQQAYNLVDGWIAGNFIGAVALGAVGTCYPVTVFFVAIASGLSLGTSLMCSRKFGEKELSGVQEAISSSFIAFIPLSILISALGILSCPLILRLLAVPSEAAESTGAYLRIYIAGFPFVFLYNISNSVLTGLGNSKTPLFFLVISSAVNILLDAVFVLKLGLGAEGLALATLISQALAGALAAAVVLKVYRSLGRRSKLWSLSLLGEILSLGIPSMLQHIFMSLGQLAVQNVINSYGLIVMAGYSVAFRINGIVINSLMALSNALSGFIAQNRGAGKTERISTGLRKSLLGAYVFSTVTVAVLGVFGQGILGFFIKDDRDAAAIVSAGMGFVRIVSPFYLLVCAKICFDGALRGIGAMRAFMAAATADVAVRIIFGRLFSDWFGITGLWFLWPFAWLIGTAVSAGSWLYLSKHGCTHRGSGPSVSCK